MNKEYPNTLGSERSVEVPFIVEKVKQYAGGKKLLDVGGMPTWPGLLHEMFVEINRLKIQYSVCDFIGGEYKGDFITYDFADKKFDVIMFLSSLEHFPQCTEGDLIYREGEDRKGFEKALKILNDDGIILLTVPYGKRMWQNYHQTYDYELIQELSRGSNIVEEYAYKFENNKWIQNPVHDMIHMELGQVLGVGCFVFKKERP